MSEHFYQLYEYPTTSPTPTRSHPNQLRAISRIHTRKAELWDGFYGYGGQDLTGFYLAVLTNMGLREAVRHVPISKWLETIQEVALQNPKLDDALRDRLNRGITDLMAVADYLEE